jgi:hypothetical protein
MNTVIDRMTEQQDRFIELLTTWQKPVVAFVGRGVAAVTEQTAKLPRFAAAEKMTERLPKFELPTATQVIETQFAFAAKLLDTNKAFALELADAFDGEAPATETKAAAKPAPKAKPAAK